MKKPLGRGFFYRSGAGYSSLDELDLLGLSVVFSLDGVFSLLSLGFGLLVFRPCPDGERWSVA
jgi:hypothetical protein